MKRSGCATAAQARKRCHIAPVRIGRDAETMHAGVDLQPHEHRLVAAQFFQRRHLKFMMHDGFEAMLRDLGQFLSISETFQ